MLKKQKFVYSLSVGKLTFNNKSVLERIKNVTKIFHKYLSKGKWKYKWDELQRLIKKSK